VYVIALVLSALAVAAEIPPSPRIEQVGSALRAQRVRAVDTFWKEVSAQGGTPLVECPATLAPDCLVTFLWRGDASTRNVVVRGEALPGEPSEHTFARLPDTDIWHRTYRFRNDARFMYMLSINDPLTSWDVEGPERRKRYAGVRADPLNPRTACYVSLPRAPSEKWSEERPGVARGTIRQHHLSSAAYSDERTVEVYATPGFAPGNAITPVIILFDGEESKRNLKVPVILDNLFSEHRLPPMLAVFVDQPYEQRETDLGCSKATSSFIAGELLPWLRKEYGIRTSPASTVAAGASLGGLAAAYTALDHPEAVGRVLSQSGAFWWGRTDTEHEWLTAQFRSRPGVAVRLYLDVGLMETTGGAISQLETNRKLREVLTAKGYDVVYGEFNGPHAFPCWRANFADALLTLLMK
jgi:enterochelin esterase-like enzyme